MNNFIEKVRTIIWVMALLGSTFTSGNLWRARGQSAPLQTFDVASIKLAGSDPNLWSSLKRSGGRISWTTNRLTLVLYAYSLKPFQLAGVARENVFFAIDAETDPSATDQQVRLMFRQLLAERFKFVAHRDTRKVPVYVLTIGRGGSKIRALRPDDTPSELPASLKGKKIGEGNVVSLMDGHQHILIGRRVTLAQLCTAIALELHSTVEDKTGLQGEYDIDVTFVPDTAPTTPQTDGLTLAPAIRQQLGLQLQRETGTVEILIVDRMEKTPTAN